MLLSLVEMPIHKSHMECPAL